MTIEAIGAALSLTQVSAASVGATAGAPVAPGVFDALVQNVQDLNSQMTVDQATIQSLAAGKSDDLHRVIMDLESTKLKFDLALQVRNKVLDAYQELMRMQI
jgi:flagellar hook-basal body complex protein FliE